MRVTKYIPDRLYGFIGDSNGAQAFFHLEVFRPLLVWVTPTRCERCPHTECIWAKTPPPPILGEPVEATVAPGDPTGGKAPRAERVVRLDAPLAHAGTVDTFDAGRGYGFVRGDDSISYHLHKSEVIDGRVPLPGQKLMFYGGLRQGRPRACHVKVCPT